MSQDNATNVSESVSGALSIGTDGALGLSDDIKLVRYISRHVSLTLGHYLPLLKTKSFISRVEHRKCSLQENCFFCQMSAHSVVIHFSIFHPMESSLDHFTSIRCAFIETNRRITKFNRISTDKNNKKLSNSL